MLSAGRKKWLKVQGLGWQLNLTLPIDVHCSKNNRIWQVFVRKAHKNYATATLEYVVAYLRQTPLANPETKEQWLALVEKREKCSLEGLDGATFTYSGSKKVTGVLRDMPPMNVIDAEDNTKGVSVKNIRGHPEKSEIRIEVRVNSVGYPTSSRVDCGRAKTKELIDKTKDAWLYVKAMMKQMASTRDQWDTKDEVRRSFWKAVRGYVEEGVKKVTSQGIYALAKEHLTLSVESAVGAAGVGVGASACKGSKVGGQGIVAKGVTPVVTIMTGASAGTGSESLGKTADDGVGTTKKRRVTTHQIAGSREGIGADRPSPDDATVLAQETSERCFLVDPSAAYLECYGVGLGCGAGVPIRKSGSPFFSDIADTPYEMGGSPGEILSDLDGDLYPRSVVAGRILDEWDNVVTVTPIQSALASADPYPGKGLGAPQVEGRVEP